MSRIRLAVALLIVVIWSGTILADYFDDTYQAPQGVTAVMLVAAGYLFGAEAVKGLRRNGNGNGNGGNNDG